VWIIVAVVAFLFGIGVGAASGESDDTSTDAAKTTETKTITVSADAPAVSTVTAAPVTVTYTPPAPPPPPGPKTTFGNGTWRVGKDIQAGTYHTNGGSGCYWERQSGTGGSLDDIIANDNATGPVTVTIDETDAAFKSQGCGTWTLE
jgi:hypothetical protein